MLYHAITHVIILYYIPKDGMDEILIKDFVDGCMQLRGNASCIDLMFLARLLLLNKLSIYLLVNLTTKHIY